MQQVEWNGEERLHRAVDVHAEHTKTLAAVRSAQSASAAVPAREVRLDGAAIACRKAAFVRRRLDDLAGDLVSEHTGKSHQRLRAGERVEIRAAHSHTPYADQRLVRAARRHRYVALDEPARLLQDDLSHSVGQKLTSGFRRLVPVKPKWQKNTA
jgi:hypothetical protein